MSASMYPGGIVPTQHVGLSPRGLAGVITYAILWSLASFFVGLRFLARRAPNRPGADDWMTLASLVFTGGLVICAIIASTDGGIGWHTIALPPSQLETFGKIFYAEQILYSVSLTLIKVAVLLLYRRIFETRNFRIATYLVGLLCIGWGVGVCLAAIFQCDPIAGAWNPPIARHCIDAKGFFYGNGISTMLLDFIILSMPMFVLWKLQLDIKRKAALTGMFLLGGFVCITSILRITFLKTTDRSDFTWSIAIANVWSLVEPCVGIICACLPTLGPLFKSAYNKHIASRYGNSDGKKGSSSLKGNMRYEELQEGNFIDGKSGPRKGQAPLDTISRFDEHATYETARTEEDDIHMQDFRRMVR